jgi:hypothetical protein
MNILITILASLILTVTHTLFDFRPESNLDSWRIVDDVVMGGRSDGRFYIGDEGHAVFNGIVSLENNGGFSLVRYRFP